MLRALRIRNFAILPEVEISFSEGLNVLTGETGAGKSLLMDAIGLLTGARASSDDVRAGADMAVVEGVLQPDARSPIRALLEEAGVSVSEPEIVIRRVIGSDGRNRVFVNDTQWTNAGLAKLTPYWIDISGQHGQQRLLDESTHVELLDTFGNYQKVFEDYRSHFQAVRALDAEILKLQTERAEVERQREFFLFQLNELREAELKADEEREVTAFHQRLANRERLARAAALIEDTLGGEDGVEDRIGRVLSEAQAMEKLDSTVASWTTELVDLQARISEVSTGAADYVRQLEFEPGEMERIEERLAVLQRIRRKYGSIERAIEERDRIQTLLSDVEEEGDRESALLAERKARARKMVDVAQRLSRARKKSAKDFARRIVGELHRLAMPNADFTVQFDRVLTGVEALEVDGRCFAASGGETVRFELAPNEGEGFKPLAKIVSGGELSRVLLALKGVAVASVDVAEVTYLFDEVDTGIGGQTAEHVGIRLRTLAQGRQVLNVTHLAQIACYADVHLRVSKKVEEGRTLGSIELLDQKGREAELARMLGGIRITAKVRDHAEELLLKGGGITGARRIAQGSPSGR